MKKLTKKELRHDPFLEALEKLTGVMKTHGNRILWGAIIALAVVVVAMVIINQNKQGATEAQWKFLQAVSLFSQGDTTQALPILGDLTQTYGNHGTIKG